MLRFLLYRPIAVSMSLAALLAISLLAFLHLPLSLLPDADVPYITLSVRLPNSAPEEIEQNVLRPLRESMLSLNNLKAVESTAQNETGSVRLQFAYGTDMKLAYIEVNEKVDRLIPILPRNMERPLVIQSTAGDIPVVRVQVVPASEESMQVASDVALFTLKRRLEQLEGVGLVDINGLQQPVIRINPDYTLLASLHLTDADLQRTLQQAGISVGALTVRDGNYRYFLRLSSRTAHPEELGVLPVVLPDNTSIALNKVAEIQLGSDAPAGYHLYNGRTGIVLNVHKQAEARIPEVKDRIYKAVDQFKKDFPDLQFAVTQDQSILLDLSIDNLTQALLWGGTFAFAVLFIFMGSWREPVMMGVVLPVSLVLSFSGLYLLDISLNIVSLSGLALGLGMLVDNSIVVVDSISLKRREGLAITDACVAGTAEVMIPLVSSALTNLAVFLPLIFMSGITGTLFFDQALSVAIILSVSLACTFIVIPLLYRMLYSNPDLRTREDSGFFLFLKRKYHQSFRWVWERRRIALPAMFMLVPVAIILLIYMPKSGFPELNRDETVVEIDWNEPISADENRRRVVWLMHELRTQVVHAEADVGYQQYVLSPVVQSPRQATLYCKHPSPKHLQYTRAWLESLFQSRYPSSRLLLKDAPNAFEQLFVTNQPALEARFRQPRVSMLLSDTTAEQLIRYSAQLDKTMIGPGLEQETTALMEVDYNRLGKYSVTLDELIRSLEILFGQYRITDLREFGRNIPVFLVRNQQDATQLIQQTFVRARDGTHYPLGDFIRIRYEQRYRNITADASGTYQSIQVQQVSDLNQMISFFRSIAQQLGLAVDFTGAWFENRDNLRQLFFILLVSILLMYFILTAEFESFKQPLLVMASLPAGLAGGLILLWLSGGSLNIMSGIGLVVVLGILDNDAILKIDRINMLRRKMQLEAAIQQAGLDRLKPIVMNTCTNVLAITPILFASGLGADLQRPVAITTIGGLIVATLTSLYFIPLLYAALYGKSKQ